MPTRKLRINAEFDIDDELRVFRQWQRVQERLLALMEQVSDGQTQCVRSSLNRCLWQETSGAARIWWEPVDAAIAAESGAMYEVGAQGRRYGMLKLKPGYFESTLMPRIPHAFASLCGFVLVYIEHRTFVAHQLQHLPPIGNGRSIRLTARERELLWSLVRGESEAEAARSMYIELTTVRAHRHRLYNALEVHSATEAVSRSFALRLVDWLDVPVESADAESDRDVGT